MIPRTLGRPFYGRAILTTTACLAAMCAATAATVDDSLFQRDQLALSQLVSQVLHRNPEVRQRAAEADASAALAIQAGALDDPRLSYAMAPRTADLQGKDFGQRLTISQKLPWPGKRELAAHNWRLETQARREQIRNSRQRLVRLSAEAYADWYLSHAAQAINDKRKASWRDYRHLAELNYIAGRVGKQDVLKAEVGYYRLEHRDIKLARQRSAARTRINNLLDRPAEASLPPPAEHLQLTGLLDAAPATGEQVWTRRPELRALEHRLAAAGTRQEQARLMDYPDFDVSTGWNSLWDSTEKRWTIGLSINVPLDGNKRRAARDQARAERLRLEAERDALRNAVSTQVQQAYDGLAEARHELSLYRERLLPAAREALESSRTEYQSGSGDFLALINTENNLFQIELDALEAEVSAFRRLAELQWSLGIDGPQAIARTGIQSALHVSEGDKP